MLDSDVAEDGPDPHPARPTSVVHDERPSAVPSLEYYPMAKQFLFGVYPQELEQLDSGGTSSNEINFGVAAIAAAVGAGLGLIAAAYPVIVGALAVLMCLIGAKWLAGGLRASKGRKTLAQQIRQRHATQASPSGSANSVPDAARAGDGIAGGEGGGRLPVVAMNPVIDKLIDIGVGQSVFVRFQGEFARVYLLDNENVARYRSSMGFRYAAGGGYPGNPAYPSGVEVRPPSPGTWWLVVDHGHVPGLLSASYAILST